MSMMSTCKFFLQGTCKFGDSCRFSHQINDTSQIHGTSIMRQNSKPSTIDTNLLVKSVVTDMINAEKGGHWMLSSYTPFKDKPFFPGFENQSFEEVRYGYCEAIKTGTIEQYKQQLQNALQEAAMKMKVLQNPSSEIISMLIQIYNTPINNATFTSPQSNPVPQQNQTQSGSIFAIANQQLFGKSTNQQQSIFGGTATNANNIFSGATQQNTNQNMFSNNQQSIFNNQQPFSDTSNKSIFGNQNFVASAGSNYQNSPFAAQSPPYSTQNNVFAQPNTNIFQTSSNSPLGNSGQSVSISPFSQNQPCNNMNPVSTNTLPSLFGGQTQQSIYASKAGQNLQVGLPAMEQPQESSQMSSTANTILNVPTPNTNIFAQQTSIFNNQGPDQNLTNSIFAQNVPQSGNMFVGSTEMIDSRAYSKLEDLSESDIESFQSDSFEFGKIPEKPPTEQMCN